LTGYLLLSDFFSFVLGALVGSFLNVCICRIPKSESVAFPPSHCTTCAYLIRWYDNIPMLSWALLRGKCRSCGGRISPQYPLVELGNGLLSLALFLKFGPGLAYAVLFLLCSALVVVTCIDLEHQVIPDSITLPGIVIGFASSCLIFDFGWLDSLTGLLVGGGSLLLFACGYGFFTGKDGMGGGDIKLLAMIGAFFGWKAVLFIICAASLLGSLIGVGVMLARRKDATLAIPFGPFLAGASVLYIFFGRALLRWYLRFY
jgi:leader peptidase (prepilin peptidase) / N-methyltransferase